MSVASRFSRVSGPTALVVSVFSLVLGLGGVSVAAVSLAKNSVGSAQIKNNSVRSADVKNNSLTTSDVKDHSLLAKDFKAGQLPKGAKGNRGLQGATGSPGAPGTAQGWAYVSSVGSVLASGGAHPPTVTKEGTGIYDLTGTGWTATLGSTVLSRHGVLPGVSVSGTTAVRATSTAATYSPLLLHPSTPAKVYTYDQSGAAADEPFLVFLP